MNDLMSDMQILTTTTMMPALEQKLFLGQEWEKLCKVEQHHSWDSRNLWSHIYLGSSTSSSTCELSDPGKVT